MLHDLRCVDDPGFLGGAWVIGGLLYNRRCLERLGSQLAYASGVLSRLDILMSSLLLAVSDVLSLTTIYIIICTVLVVLSSTG